MRTIIAGSRGIFDKTLLYKVIKRSNLHITAVLSGGAKGVDRLGEIYAFENKVKLVKHPALWHTHGNKAGMLRNTEMALDADALISLWDGESSGTLDMIRKVKDRGLIYVIFNTKYKEYDYGVK